MSDKGKGCIKWTLGGCGCLVLCFILAGSGLALSFKLSEPEDPVITSLEGNDPFSSNLENSGLILPENPNKPIHVILDMAMVELRVLPDSTDSGVHVDGKYDKANFDLETNMTDKGDYLEYRVGFDRNKSWFSFIKGDDHNFENRLQIHLPKNVPIRFDMNMKMGEANVDLSGTTLTNADIDVKMGEFNLEASEPNPIAMEEMNLKFSMGEMNVNDIQNFRAKNLEVQGRMGEINMNNSAPWIEDTQAELKMTMGNMTLYVPENVAVKSSLKAAMGHVENLAKKNPAPSLGDVKTIEVKGLARFGEVRVLPGRKRMNINRQIMRLAQEEGIESALNRLREIREKEADVYRIGPSSINSLGYSFLWQGKKDEAIEIFKLNVEFHPNYANGFDSLGEGYLERGDLELALQNYKKAFDMDPDQDSAIRAIRRIERMIEERGLGETAQKGD